MSPLPEQFANRWRDGYGAADPGHGTLYWHVLLGRDMEFRKNAAAAQRRLARFPGLHMTPLQWLHLTVLNAGHVEGISDTAIAEMLEIARTYLSDTGTRIIPVNLSRVLYHPEAIVLAADPADSLNPILQAARKATLAVTGQKGTMGRYSQRWIPHVTLCYSTGIQPAGPVIAELGKRLLGCQASIDNLSLVVQHGSEWLWNWSPAGSVSLPER